MPSIISPSLQNFAQLAQAGGRFGRIVEQQGGIAQTGVLGGLRASCAANRATGEAFLKSLRAQYGDAIADTLSADLRAVRDQGKPLRARVARDILAKAGDMAASLHRVNNDAAQRFLLGGAGLDGRNFDAAFAQFCASKGLEPAEEPVLKQDFMNCVRQAADQGKSIVTPSQLAEATARGSLPGMERAAAATATRHFMADGGPQGMNAALDAFARQSGLTETQKTDCRAFLGMTLEAHPQAEPQTLFRLISDGSLPGLSIFAAACGKATPIANAVIRDAVGWQAARPLDTAVMMHEYGPGVNIAIANLYLGNMTAIRALQPEGIPSHENVWQACFGQPMPDTLKNCDAKTFNKAVDDALMDKFNTAADGDVHKAMTPMLCMSTGISLAKSLEAIHPPATLTQADFIGKGGLTPPSRLPDIDGAEQSIAKDLNRRGTHVPLAGFMPTVSFQVPGEAATTVNIQDTSGLSDTEKEQFANGMPTPISHRLVELARTLCGDNEMQARQVVLSMGQSGAFILRNASALTGIQLSEHSPMNVAINRESDGQVRMRFSTPPELPLEATYSFLIGPDGAATLDDCLLRARPAQ